MGELFKSTYTIDDMKKWACRSCWTEKICRKKIKQPQRKWEILSKRKKTKKMKSKKKAGRADQRLLFC